MQEQFEEEYEDIDEEDDKSPATMTPAGKLSFIRDKHELSNTLKYLAKPVFNWCIHVLFWDKLC